MEQAETFTNGVEADEWTAPLWRGLLGRLVVSVWLVLRRRKARPGSFDHPHARKVHPFHARTLLNRGDQIRRDTLTQSSEETT